MRARKATSRRDRPTGHVTGSRLTQQRAIRTRPAAAAAVTLPRCYRSRNLRNASFSINPARGKRIDGARWTTPSHRRLRVPEIRMFFLLVFFPPPRLVFFLPRLPARELLIFPNSDFRRVGRVTRRAGRILRARRNSSAVQRLAN